MSEPAAPPDPPPRVREATSDGPPIGTSASNVTLKRRGPDGERTFHIIGTAHVSRQSVDEVRRVIAEVKPDTVCVELDEMRYEALTDETRWRRLDVFDVIKQGKVLFLMANLALQAFQKRLGDQLGVRPGAELLAAVEEAEAVGAEVVLADRNVQATLRRTWAALGFIEKIKLIGILFASMFAGDEISEEDVERLKEREHFQDAMSQFATYVPSVKAPLIDERDAYLMSRIEDSPGRTVVAVVGAGHVAGLTTWLGKKVDREALSALPRPSMWSRAFKWLIPVLVLLAFGYGYHEHQGTGLLELLKAWVIPNAVAAGLFTAVAGGKVLSALTAVVASPITSLNPLVGAAIPVGLVEAYLRRPTVEDCERLAEDTTTFAGMRKNPLSRILMVAIAANIGSALGAYVGIGWIATRLF
ncbi:MAG: TraB/GumN family protein [Myxococcota bacterium]